MLGDRMKALIAPARSAKWGSRSPFSGLFAFRSAPFGGFRAHQGPKVMVRPCQVAHSNQVVGRVGQQTQMVDSRHTADLH